MAGVKNGVTITDQYYYYFGAAELIWPAALRYSQCRNHLLSITRSNPIVLMKNTLLRHPTFLPQFYFHVLCRTNKCFRRATRICVTQKYLHRYIVSGLEFEVVQIQFNNSQRLCIASVSGLPYGRQFPLFLPALLSCILFREPTPISPTWGWAFEPNWDMPQ